MLFSGCSTIRPAMSFFLTSDAHSVIQPIRYFMMESCFISLIKQSEGVKWLLTFKALL